MPCSGLDGHTRGKGSTGDELGSLYPSPLFFETLLK